MKFPIAFNDFYVTFFSSNTIIICKRQNSVTVRILTYEWNVNQMPLRKHLIKTMDVKIITETLVTCLIDKMKFKIILHFLQKLF